MRWDDMNAACLYGHLCPLGGYSVDVEQSRDPGRASGRGQSTRKTSVNWSEAGCLQCESGWICVCLFPVSVTVND